MFADSLLWQKLNEHKLETISVLYLSSSITTRTEPSADFLRQHYTHLFVDRTPMEQDPLTKSVKALLVSAQQILDKPRGTTDFRWCIKIESSSSTVNSTMEIFLSKNPRNYVARIGSVFYKLDEKPAEYFFDQFAKLFSP